MGMGMREKMIELLASKVCDAYSPTCDEWQPHNCGQCYANDCRIADLADHLIANDVVQVVRCKECKYYDEKDEDCNHPGLWAEYASDFGLGMYPDDFCSIGERRNDGV